MSIHLKNIGKIYKNQVIFKGVNLSFETSKKYAILGSNGSGKSTLLKVISGFVTPSKGKIISNFKDYSRQVSFCAPYISLINELSIWEMIKLHFNCNGHVYSEEKLLDQIGIPLNKISGKTIGDFSSGMKQRLKLGLSILSPKPILLLDEPCSNLDKTGVNWYQNLLHENSDERIIIIASNRRDEEIGEVKEMIEIESYRK